MCKNLFRYLTRGIHLGTKLFKKAFKMNPSSTRELSRTFGCYLSNFSTELIEIGQRHSYEVRKFIPFQRHPFCFIIF